MGAFMFKVIEPQYHCFNKLSIDRFMELIHMHSTDFSEHEKNKATFIVAEDREDGVHGGAFLYKKRLDEFPPELINALSDFLLPVEWVWDCIVTLSIDDDSILYKMNEVDRFCHIFYRNLYNRLKFLGKNEDVGFLCISLFSAEYIYMEEFISWPYILELKPQESSDGLFHGILPLIGSQCEAYQLQIHPVVPT